nr:hypothetical protein [Tanacetum cinerariifolium]
MEVFGENPTRIVDGYSKEFETMSLYHMKRIHMFSRLVAAVVYNEYIYDMHHVHMNSTHWATLTEEKGKKGMVAGVVRKVIDKYVGEIEMIESKHKLRVDQEDLDTVIVKIGEWCVSWVECEIVECQYQ